MQQVTWFIELISSIAQRKGYTLISIQFIIRKGNAINYYLLTLSLLLNQSDNLFIPFFQYFHLRDTHTNHLTFLRILKFGN